MVFCLKFLYDIYVYAFCCRCIGHSTCNQNPQLAARLGHLLDVGYLCVSGAKMHTFANKFAEINVGQLPADRFLMVLCPVLQAYKVLVFDLDTIYTPNKWLLYRVKKLDVSSLNTEDM